MAFPSMRSCLGTPLVKKLTLALLTSAHASPLSEQDGESEEKDREQKDNDPHGGHENHHLFVPRLPLFFLYIFTQRESIARNLVV